MRRLRVAVFHASGSANETLSYQQGWPTAIARHPAFDVADVNLARRGVSFVRGRALGRMDAIVLLHSVFSNECAIPAPLADRIARVAAHKVFFVGNEYKLMPEKIAFAEAIGVTLLVSQLSSPAAHELYRQRLGCAVAGIPNTGFDPEIFAPTRPRAARPVDVGYRAYASPLYLGHDERTELAERVQAAASRRRLTTDISLAPEDRFDQRGWAAFLNRCKAQVGSEAGGDRFELTDATRHAVNAYLGERSDVALAEIRQRFFDHTSGDVSGRALSGRIVEGAATKTVQLLLEGEYGGFFAPDVHYVPLRKDYANLDEALERLGDDTECARLADAAYDVARSELTYERLVDRLHEALLPLVDG